MEALVGPGTYWLRHSSAHGSTIKISECTNSCCPASSSTGLSLPCVCHAGTRLPLSDGLRYRHLIGQNIKRAECEEKGSRGIGFSTSGSWKIFGGSMAQHRPAPSLVGCWSHSRGLCSTREGLGWQHRPPSLPSTNKLRGRCRFRRVASPKALNLSLRRRLNPFPEKVGRIRALNPDSRPEASTSLTSNSGSGDSQDLPEVFLQAREILRPGQVAAETPKALYGLRIVTSPDAQSGLSIPHAGVQVAILGEGRSTIVVQRIGRLVEGAVAETSRQRGGQAAVSTNSTRGGPTFPPGSVEGGLAEGGDEEEDDAEAGTGAGQPMPAGAWTSFAADRPTVGGGEATRGGVTGGEEEGQAGRDGAAPLLGRGVFLGAGEGTFERAAEDEVWMVGPRVGRVQALWIAPEAGTWRLERASLLVVPIPENGDKTADVSSPSAQSAASAAARVAAVAGSGVASHRVPAGRGSSGGGVPEPRGLAALGTTYLFHGGEGGCLLGDSTEWPALELQPMAVEEGILVPYGDGAGEGVWGEGGTGGVESMREERELSRLAESGAVALAWAQKAGAGEGVGRGSEGTLSYGEKAQKREESMKEYRELKEFLLSTTGFLVLVGTLGALAVGGVGPARGFAVGGAAALLYLLRLQNTVDRIPAPGDTAIGQSSGPSALEESEVEIGPERKGGRGGRVAAAMGRRDDSGAELRSGGFKTGLGYAWERGSTTGSGAGSETGVDGLPVGSAWGMADGCELDFEPSTMAPGGRNVVDLFGAPAGGAASTNESPPTGVGSGSQESLEFYTRVVECVLKLMQWMLRWKPYLPAAAGRRLEQAEGTCLVLLEMGEEEHRLWASTRAAFAQQRQLAEEYHALVARQDPADPLYGGEACAVGPLLQSLHLSVYQAKVAQFQEQLVEERAALGRLEARRREVMARLGMWDGEGGEGGREEEPGKDDPGEGNGLAAADKRQLPNPGAVWTAVAGPLSRIALTLGAAVLVGKMAQGAGATVPSADLFAGALGFLTYKLAVLLAAFRPALAGGDEEVVEAEEEVR